DNLESLEIHHGSLAPTTLETLGELPQLKSFGRNWTQDRASATLVQSVKDKTSGLEGLTIQGSLTKEIAGIICDMPKLRSLFVQLDKAPESGLEVLSQSRTLTYIALMQGRLVNGNGLKKLAAMPQLELLSLSGSFVDDEFLPAFSGHQLRRLDLCVVEDAKKAANALTQLPNLTELQLEGPNWPDDQVLAVVEAERSVTLKLRLTNTAVTPKTVKRLGSMPGIGLVSGANMTAPADRQFSAWLLGRGAGVEGVAVKGTHSESGETRFAIEKMYDIVTLPEYRIEKIDVSTANVTLVEFAKQLNALPYSVKKLVVPRDGWSPDALNASGLTDHVDQIVTMESE
ncbi:MAG: hypothetical protein AAF497_27250, partial [Planctomycetota bacterium]